MMKRLNVLAVLAVLAGLVIAVPSFAADGPPLPGTKPLTWEGDIASHLVDGVDRFLLNELKLSIDRRRKHWKRDFSSVEAFNKSIEPNRKRLAHILGVRDPRVAFDAPELVATVEQPARIARGNGFDVFAVRWPVLGHPQPGGDNTVSIHGVGLLLVPTGRKPVASVVAVPDADQTPEQIAGLEGNLPAQSQLARRLAESGCRVLVPMILSRELKKRNGRATTTNREYIYRSAFELGRHLIGYEVQQILAGVDWFTKDAVDGDATIGVIGYGEGGRLALYAGAIDTRIDATCVTGCFGPREGAWNEPLDRNVFGMLEQFGDAEIAAMYAGRSLLVEASDGPEVELPGSGGAPAELTSPSVRAANQEWKRTEDILADAKFDSDMSMTSIAGDSQDAGHSLSVFLSSLGINDKLAKGAGKVTVTHKLDTAQRQERQLEEMDRHNQLLLRESAFVRKAYMSKLDTKSLEGYEKSVEQYRDRFRNDVIGHFDYDLLPPNARTRKTWDSEKWTGYEVVLDVFPDVIAYGVLLLPKDLKPDEKRPVVVCQHGLEGRPTDVFLNDHRAYHDFAAKLAERGFITFAPQNLYIFRDRFRTLQRKANPIGKTLFSVIVPQHQQIVNWLKKLPGVDPERIAFYGLSYGGKSAMRIPALVTDYCLSICSADFNEWVRKNASSRHNFSYVWTGEYEIFEFDLGSTFNYAEMAALICPRPFMVERGHFDGVGEDEWVAYEFAKVRYLYAAKLGIGDRAEIEWFVGPHTINGKGTYEFLHRHLDWPKR